MFIYKITNKINGKIYIGQTINSINLRWQQHLSKNENCRVLKRAINKYGKENFIIEEIDGANNLSELNYLEKHYILTLDSLSPKGYNLREGGSNGGKCSEDTKKKMSEAQKKWKRPPRNPEKEKNRIKKLKEAVCRKIVDCSTGRIYKSIKECSLDLDIPASNISFALKNKNSLCRGKFFKYFKEWDGRIIKEKISGKGAYQSKKLRKIYCINNKQVYKNIKEASNNLGLNKDSLRRYVRENREYKGYLFKYIDS